MNSGKNRIGLILSTIHSNTAQSTWASFVRIAKTEGKDLIIFPGGVLNARANSDHLRNNIYSLVNDCNLDGLICWTSVIKGNLSTEELERFHSGFEPLPYVTLAYKLQGHPYVEFDCQVGMKQLISHCINVHGAKKIAFLRGPKMHPYAQARFSGYLDA